MSLLKRIEQGQGGSSGQSSNNQGGDSSKLSSLQARRVNAPITSPQAGSYFDLKTRVQNKLLSELDPSMDITRTDEVRKTIQDLFEQILAEENIVLSRPERARLFEQIAAEILGFGPLQPLLEDDTITEIMVNGAKNLYIERKGKVHRVPVTFENNDHVMRIIDRIVAPLGRRIDESSPYVDARLPDGSRVNAVIPPISLIGPVLTIRKFSRNPITVEQLIQFGSITAEGVQFLKACVESRLNIRQDDPAQCSLWFHPRR
jgi:pilus assembly protein CpaF